MKVASSRYLLDRKAYLKELIAALREKYSYASVLAADAKAYQFSVSRAGIQVSEDTRFSERGFVVRVYDGTNYAEYSFNEIGRETIPEIVKKVEKELLPLDAEVPGSVTKKRNRQQTDEGTVFSGSTSYEIHPDEMGNDEIVRRLSALREDGLKAVEGLVEFRTFLSYQEIHKLFLTDKTDMEQNVLWTCGGILAMAPAGGALKDSMQGYSVLGGVELLDRMAHDVERVAKTAVELTKAEPLKPGTYECVCTPSVTGMIVHEAFGHGVEMDMFVKDRALAKYNVGTKVASELVTMRDTACALNDAGSYFFDDEGTLSKDTVIIEKGILKRGMCDAASAGYLGTEPTGNGRRESFQRKAYTRMTNTVFEAGHDKVEDMIASVKDGLLLAEPTSGMEDPKNWGIQCMVNYAREIKDGKLTGRIFSPIVLTGFVPDLLKSITMMSDTMETCGSGFCGKGHKEWVKVSDGGPWIKATIRLG